LVGAFWFLVTVLVALLPIGALTLMYWSRLGKNPGLDYLLGGGELLVVIIGVSAQAVVDGGRLGFGWTLPRPLKGLVGTFAVLAGLALLAAALWYGSLLSPTKTDVGGIRTLSSEEFHRVAQGSLVIFAIAVLVGLIFAGIKEAIQDA
jgi:cytochrome bd-type quinol oxidase subunit 2